LRVSPSQIKVWQECQQKWHYNYVDGLISKKERKKFDKGLYTHELLHVYYHTLEAGYKPGSDFALDFMLSRMKSDLQEIDMDNLHVMKDIMPLISKFVSWQSPQIDNDIAEIVGVEHEFFYEHEGVTMHGIIDLVYRTKSTGRLIIRDHKTSEQKNSWFQDKLTLNDQLPFYDAALSKMFGEKVQRVEVNFINTYPYKQPPPNSEIFKVFVWEYTETFNKNFLDNLVRTHGKMTEPPIRNLAMCTYCDYKVLCHLAMKEQGNAVALTQFTKRDV
jgi:hypothetical protein